MRVPHNIFSNNHMPMFIPTKVAIAFSIEHVVNNCPIPFQCPNPRFKIRFTLQHSMR
ncbi:hypothetical protein F383_33928 [Gossypium arboreum]|uniref:Uncharacterized protein n=1 Tax=Gossypium arboreum TaxID=29729 RepID=A0A0B0N769_GOSAR|nr:hypothetical protein F383_33928 [Gossypium arboreum]